jgi:hypothetical protein
MRNHKYINFAVFFFVLISCISKRNINSINHTKSVTEKSECNDGVSPILEIWNHTGNEFIIGRYGVIKDEYVKSEGWDNDDFPFPKKYDVKITLVSNERLYDNEFYKIPSCTLRLDVSYNVGQSKNSTYLLNSYILEKKIIVPSKVIESIKFKDIDGKTNFYEFIVSGVDLEEVYKKVRKKGQFLNQLIFNIQIKNDSNYCNYEYRFPVNKS